MNIISSLNLYVSEYHKNYHYTKVYIDMVESEILTRDREKLPGHTSYNRSLKPSLHKQIYRTTNKLQFFAAIFCGDFIIENHIRSDFMPTFRRFNLSQGIWTSKFSCKSLQFLLISYMSPKLRFLRKFYRKVNSRRFYTDNLRNTLY